MSDPIGCQNTLILIVAEKSAVFEKGKNYAIKKNATSQQKCRSCKKNAANRKHGTVCESYSRRLQSNSFQLLFQPRNIHKVKKEKSNQTILGDCSLLR